jgi:hypothetical protein
MMIGGPSTRATENASDAVSGIEPQEITMTIHRTIIAAAFALTVAGAAQADGLQPVEGRSIDLGDVSGIAYYTVEPDGFRVVATVAQGEAGTPVRLEAVLAPNQSVVLSSPRVGSVAPNSIEISRRGDQVLVHQAAVTN